VSPHELHRVLGTEALQEYLLQEVQAVYRGQDLRVDDKHIEVIVAQMLGKVRGQGRVAAAGPAAGRHQSGRAVRELPQKGLPAVASIFKVTVIQYWLHNAWLDAEGRPCAAGTPGARFVKARKMPKGTPGARKVKKKSGKWYGRVPGSARPVPLSPNKVAAQ
jgi:hypothetical protein